MGNAGAARGRTVFSHAFTGIAGSLVRGRLKVARCPHRAMTRIKNAPSSVIAYGDATFPPVGGKALGVRFTGFPP